MKITYVSIEILIPDKPQTTNQLLKHIYRA